MQSIFWIAILDLLAVSIETTTSSITETTQSLDLVECFNASDKGASYRGLVAQTESGKTCQSWSEQAPHGHDRTPERYPDSGLKMNYCRNPDGEPRPWCYTTEENRRWELCKIKECSGSLKPPKDRFKWYGGCRTENFQHWSTKRGKCKWTKSFWDPEEAERNNMTSCNGDEYACSTPFRCVPRYFLNTVDGCYNNSMRTIVPCRDNEFMCNRTRRCVPRWAVADNIADCNDFRIGDNSDEIRGPYNKCLRDEFRCESTGRCIPREWVLDGENDCSGQKDNSSDEREPLATCHQDMESRCLDTGRCLLRFRVMDGYIDCKDKSDEIQPLSNCTKAEFRCKDTGRCIPRSWLMDSRSNCLDGSDEIQQENVTCIETEFLCHDGRRCIPDLHKCDGMQHCADCSDEIEGCETPTTWRCPGDPSKCFPQSHACDAFSDCPNHTDTMSFMPGFKCESIKTESLQVTCAVPQWMLHNDLSVCTDRSDLCFVGENFTCSHCADGKTIISPAQICDNVLDCKDLWDECLCPENGKANRTETLCKRVCYGNGGLACKNCRLGEIYCEEDDKCIKKQQLCDGKVQCPVSKVDERFCTYPKDNSVKRGSAKKSHKCEEFPPGITAAFMLIGEFEAVKDYFPKQAARCDGVLECVFFEDECNSDCQTQPIACNTILEQYVDFGTFTSHEQPVRVRTCNDFSQLMKFDDRGYLSGSMICNGIEDCRGGEDEQNCTERHECNAGTAQWITGEKNIVSIDKRRVCDGIIDCIDDESDERNCSMDTHFYCCNENPLFVPRDLVMDGKPDCQDNSDECSEASCDNSFSSSEEMIRIPFLRYFIWVMATLAILGNLGVFVEMFNVDKRTNLTSMRKCNRMLIMNLATSDFFMGIALLMIGVKSSLLSGKYCLEDDIWRTSSLCDVIGILVIMSSETSVLTLVFLTFYRLYGVYKPFASRHIDLKNVATLIAVAWTISFLVATMPVVPGARSSVVTHVLMEPSRYFVSTRVSWKEIQRFATRAIVLGNATELRSDELGDWAVIDRLREVSTIKDYMPGLLGYFGFYSTDGVCIPRLFRRAHSPHLHPLSIILVIFNFFSFFFIIISYVMIYRKSYARAKNLRTNDAQEKKNQTLQRKIAILIGTDLCCWLPICVMSFVSQAGVPLPRDVYAVAAIVLLPINSSINPFIYSNGLESIRNYLKKKITQT